MILATRWIATGSDTEFCTVACFRNMGGDSSGCAGRKFGHVSGHGSTFHLWQDQNTPSAAPWGSACLLRICVASAQWLIRQIHSKGLEGKLKSWYSDKAGCCSLLVRIPSPTNIY
jgi:hypothetical protein